MKRSAYLIVTDLHYATEKANRVNYFSEILDVLTDVIEITEKYKAQGYTVYCNLLGDVFDASITEAEDAMQAIEVFRFFCSNFEKVYSVVGNHEITFAKNNPFWFLVSELGDEGLAGLKRYIQPRGVNDAIVVPDTVTDGNVTFYFNHFGTDPKVPQTLDEVAIGLFHQNVGSTDICKIWGKFDNVEEAAYIQAYRYCFFGHLHLGKGHYYLNKERTCEGEWLGTLGRTKVDEVLPDDTKVNIPAVLIADGKFERIEDNTVTLQPPSECIDFAKLRASTKSKELVQERREQAELSYKGETLMKSLQGSLEGSPLSVLLQICAKSYPELFGQYKEGLNATLTSGEEDEENYEEMGGERDG